MMLQIEMLTTPAEIIQKFLIERNCMFWAPSMLVLAPSRLESACHVGSGQTHTSNIEERSRNNYMQH